MTKGVTQLPEDREEGLRILEAHKLHNPPNLWDEKWFIDFAKSLLSTECQFPQNVARNPNVLIDYRNGLKREGWKES